MAVSQNTLYDGVAFLEKYTEEQQLMKELQDYY